MTGLALHPLASLLQMHFWCEWSLHAKQLPPYADEAVQSTLNTALLVTADTFTMSSRQVTLLRC